MVRLMGPKFLELDVETGGLTMDSSIEDIHGFKIENKDNLHPELFAPLLEHLTPQGAEPNEIVIGALDEPTGAIAIITTTGTHRTL